MASVLQASNMVLTSPLTTIANDVSVTAAQQAQGTAAAIVTNTASQLLYSKLKTQLTSIGALRYKVDNGTATAAELSSYSQAKSNINNLVIQINTTGSLDADTQQQINNQLQQAKLKQIAGSPGGSITTATFTDFLDYIFRTQAINPYSRERACDIDFIDMMSNIASDIGDSTADLKQIMSMITTAVS